MKTTSSRSPEAARAPDYGASSTGKTQPTSFKPRLHNAWLVGTAALAIAICPLDLEAGANLRWRFGADSSLAVPSDNRIGERSYSSPALGTDGKILIMGDDLRLRSITPGSSQPSSVNWVSATTAWDLSLSPANNNNSPAVDSNGTIWFGGINSTPAWTLFAINPASGAVTWSITPGGVKTFVGAPAIDINNWVYAALEDCIFVVSPSGGSYADRWAFYNQNSPKYRTSSSLTLSDFTTSSSGGVTYTNQTLWFTETKLNGLNPIGGRLNSLNLQGSASTATYSQGWTWDFPGGSTEWAVNTPVLGPNGKIYVGSNLSKLYAITPGTSTPYWTKTLNGAVRSSVVIGFDGTLYVGTDGDSLYALNPVDGTESWSWAAGSDVVSTPLIGADGAVYIATHGGKFICLSADPSKTQATRKLWEETISGASFYYSSPVMGTDGVIYAGARNINTGQLVALNGFGRPGATPWSMFARNSRRTGQVRPAYSVTDLGLLDGMAANNLTPYGINNSSTVAGVAYHAYYYQNRAARWSAGTLTSLGTMSGYTDHYAQGINDSTLIVGKANVNSWPNTRAFKWTYGGGYTVLGSLATYSYYPLGTISTASAEAVNSGGVIVGTSKNSSQVTRAAKWAAGETTATDLQTLAGQNSSKVSFANAVNSGEFIVGGSDTTYSGNPTHGFFVNGTDQIDSTKDIGTLSGTDTDYSTANWVNDLGYIAGVSQDANGNYRAYIKTPQGTSPLSHTKNTGFVNMGVVGSASSSTLSYINNLNQGIGGASGIAALGPLHRAALVDLNTLIPSGSGWNLQQTDAANDKGEIVGFGILSGNTRGFILRPID